MHGAVDGHENAEQLAERKPHAMPGIGAVAELVGHARSPNAALTRGMAIMA